MGLFNAMSSISQINGLLKNVEYHVQIGCTLKENNASDESVKAEIKSLGVIYKEMERILANSSGARTAVYTIFGRKHRSWEAMDFIKGSMIALTYM